MHISGSLQSSLIGFQLQSYSIDPPPNPLTKRPPMAISQSTTILPFKPQAQFPHPLSSQKSRLNFFDNQVFRPTHRHFHILDHTTKSHVLSKPIPDLKTDQEIPYRWRDFHGENDWAGLLNPMDPLFRSELIRYGEMAQACYDAFDYDPFSKYCGSCRFTRRDLLTSLGMQNSGYDVTRYLYATADINLPNFFKNSRWPQVWSKNANWIGYVAVSNDATSRALGRRDVTVAWRGTVTRLEWVADLMDFLRPVSADKIIPCPDSSVKVESGFLDLYTDKIEECRFCKYSAREQILTEVKRLIDTYRDEEMSVTITGHSLGAALGIVSGYDIVETGLNVMGDGRVVPVGVYSFSGPRVGNVRFKERVEMLGLKVLRVLNVHDVVPRSPGWFFNEGVPRAVMKAAEGFLPWCYSHVGVELVLDHKDSPYLRPDGDAVCAHNLEALLHLLDGLVDHIPHFITLI